MTVQNSLRALAICVALFAPTHRAVAADCAKLLQDFKRAACFYSEKDFAQALPLFEAEARKGNAIAQAQVSKMYEFGEGTGRDIDPAIAWSERAFANGSRGQAARLATLYWTGKADREKYLAWLNAAAREGDKGAAVLLANHYLTGDLGAADPCLAYFWLRRIAPAKPSAGGDRKQMRTARDACEAKSTAPK